MRFLLTLSALVFCGALSAAELRAIRVWPGYRTSESFERISEYFSGQENPGNDTYLRSQPAVRDGFYFMVRLKNKGAAVEGARAEVQVITPDSPLPKTVSTFAPTTLRAGSHVYQVGLTGTDWPDATIQPVAWLVRFVSADGTELAREQSFLWSLPAT